MDSEMASEPKTVPLKRLYAHKVIKYVPLKWVSIGMCSYSGYVSLMWSCTINRKINGTSKGVYLPISKLHSILAVANLLPYNNL